MHLVLVPAAVDSEGLIEHAHDSTAPEGWVFFHAMEGKPLATPWQVASLRASMLAQHALPKVGWWTVRVEAASNWPLMAPHFSALSSALSSTVQERKPVPSMSTPSLDTKEAPSSLGSPTVESFPVTEPMQWAPSLRPREKTPSPFCTSTRHGLATAERTTSRKCNRRFTRC